MLARSFLTLATLEGKQAGLRLLLILGLALLAAGLAITGWLGLLAGIILALAQSNIVSWGSALGIAALLSFAVAGGLVLIIMRRSAKPLFAATRRQLGPHRNLKAEGNDGSRPLVPYEREVEEGRTAAYAEYQVIRKTFRRRLGSPLIIGGVLVAGVAVGYLGHGRRQKKNRIAPVGQGAWTQLLATVQILIPLGIALRSAVRLLASDAPTTAPQPEDGVKPAAGKCHEP